MTNDWRNDYIPNTLNSCERAANFDTIGRTKISGILHKDLGLNTFDYCSGINSHESIVV
jgi:hypothetical protein